MQSLRAQVQWLKGGTLTPPATIKIRDRYTAHGPEIFQAIQDIWVPISSPADYVETDADTFLRHFPGPPIVPRWAATVDVSLEEWKETLQKSNPRGSPGWCGWRVLELLALPDLYTRALLRILSHIQINNEWPDVLALVRTVLIPKDQTTAEAPSPSSLRPIGIASCIIRVWFRILARRMTWHLERVISANHIKAKMYGFRPGVSAEDAIGKLQYELRGRGSPLYLLFIDLQKCFDTLPRYLTWRLL